QEVTAGDFQIRQIQMAIDPREGHASSVAGRGLIPLGVMSEADATMGPADKPRGTMSQRGSALLVAAGAIAVLLAAFWMRPAVEGVGTHRQIGLPSCGWIAAADVPCPTCGMTTAFSHTVRGELPSAFVAQPFGLILAFATIAIAVFAIIIAITGRPLHHALYRWYTTRVFVVLCGVAVLAWGCKILLHKGVL
ncbi:MAG: DUF2752 domain-containing protein, partial [Phycisphaerales bacterium]|nr:DUF2752 domain-containing protein [Phycisphaerales bacterium]